MERVGRYELVEEMGRGGMGLVYRARDPATQRQHALKLLVKGRGASPASRSRFLREARALSKLRHPHVVAVHEVGEHQGAPYLVLDLLGGDSLQRRLERGGPLPVDEALAIAIKLAGALDYVHQQGLLHRDVKPDNVLFDAHGEPVLADFGLTRDVDPDSSLSALSEHGRFLGSPAYWPREQAEGLLDQLGPRSDVFALAGTLVALLTGLPPYGPAATMIEAVGRTRYLPDPPSRRRPELSPALDAVCLRALDPEPAARHPSAAAFAADLEALRAGGLPRQGRGLWRLALALLLVAGGVSLAAAWLHVRAGGAARGADVAAGGDAGGDGARGGSSDGARHGPTREGLGHDATRDGDRGDAAGGTADGGYGPGLDLARALGLDETEAATREALARSDARLVAGDLQGALAEVDEANRLRPGSPVLLYQRATLRGHLGDLQGALADFDAAIALQPGVALLRRGRGVIRVDLRDFEGALEDLDFALRHAPADTIGLFDRGLAQLGLKRYAAAVEDFSAALRLDPELGLAYYYRGAAYTELGDHAAAIADLTAAIARGAKASMAHHNRGFVYALSGQDEAALGDYARALELEPTQSETYDNRARLRYARRDYAGAQADVDALLRLDPDAAMGHFTRSLILAQQHRVGDALISVERALELDPELTSAHVHRGELLSELDYDEAALAAFELALRRDPSQVRVRYMRGRTLERLGRADEALLDYEAVLRVEPDHADALYGRGAARWRQGDLRGVVEDLERALSLNPTTTWWTHDARRYLDDARWELEHPQEE